MHEKRVKELGNFFLVGELQSPFVRNPVVSRSAHRSGCLTLSIINIPDSLQMHGSYFYHMTDFFTLENSIAATAGHTRDIQQLCAIDHLVVCEGSFSQSV